MHKLTELQRLVKDQKTLSVPKSIEVLVEGFQHFNDRQFPSSLSGVSFIRIAGQAAGLDHENSREEVMGVLNRIKTGGAFLILGHGGIIPCGAVAARKKQLDLPPGESLGEHESIHQLISSIPPSVQDMNTPHAEAENATVQARRIYEDSEFRTVICKKNITVVAGVFSGETHYNTINREWDENKLFERHHELHALRQQLVKAHQKVIGLDINLARHYAHGIFLYDPLLMRQVLDPSRPVLEVGGICCVDARVQPNTPDGPKYLYRQLPNSIFGVTIGMKNGHVSFSYDDEGSITYALGHVNGVNSLNGHGGDIGNGHIIIADNDVTFQRAKIVRVALLGLEQMRDATKDGETITMTAFNGQTLRIVNEHHGIDITQYYSPEAPGADILHTT
jgi:hypothetical protein